MGVSLTNKATGKKYTSSGGTRATVSPAVEQEKTPKTSYTSPSGSVKLTVTEKNANYVAPNKAQEDPDLLTRIVSTAKGTGERQLAGHAGTLENLLTGLGKLGSFLQDKKDAKQAAQDRAYLAQHEKELADALAAGDEEAAKWAQIKINQAKYRLKTNGDLGDYYDSVTEEAIADVDAYGDKMYAAAEKDFATAKQGANALGRLAVDAGSAVADVAADAVGNLILPGLGTAGRVSRTFGHGSEAAQGKGLGFGKQLAYGATSAAVGEGINRLFSGNPILEKATGNGALDDILFPSLGNTAGGRIIRSGIGEAIEEGTESVVDIGVQNIIMGDKADQKTAKDVGYDALIGLLVGGSTGGLSSIGRRTQNPAGKATGTQAAQSEGKVTTAQEKAAQGVSDGIMMDETQRLYGQNKTAHTNKGEAAEVVKVLSDNIPTLQTKSPVATTSSQVLKTVQGTTMAEKARKLFESVKGVVTRQGLGDVEINGRSVKDDLSHGVGPAKAATISVVPQVIQHGEQIDFQENWKGRGYDGYTFAAPVVMDGKTVYVAAVVKRTAKNRFYLHEVVDSNGNIIKMSDEDSANPTSLATNGDAGTQSSSPIDSVSGNGQNVNVENLDPFLQLMMDGKPVDGSTMDNDGLGSANAGFDPFTAAQNQYGTQKSGENPVRSDDVPVSVDGETKVSHTIVTAKGAQVTPDEFVPLIENETMKGGFSFIPITNDQSVEAAKKYITDRGWPQARADWTADVRQGKAGDQITAIGALLYNNAVNSGDARAALDILDDYQFAVRTSARGLQAARILKTLSPENRLYMIRRSIRRMVEDLKLGEDIQLPDNLVNAYMGAKTDAEVNNAVSDIQQYVADQLPSSLLDMWTALRYVNMLGNFKTQVRNVAGNVGMRAVSTAQNAVATFFETVTGGRFGKTRSVFVDGGLKSAAKQDFQTVREQALSGGKYTLDEANAFAQGVKDKQKVFRGVLAPLEGYRKATNWAMNNQYFGDEGFIKGAYARYLAGYLKANGVTAEQFSDPQWQKANGDFVDKARSFAVQQAQEVTFRDSNTLSNWVSKFGRRSDTPTVVKMVSEGMMPFRKTPANVLLRAEEYSPLGIINTALEVAHKGLSKTKLTERGGRIGAYARSGAEVSGTDIINSLSKTLTGTGIFLTGMALASAGMLRGGGTGDDEQDAFDELTGHQDYSLILEDGTSITLDWLTPASMPLFMGAELERLRQEGGVELKDLEASLTSILEPMIQMSMMQGVNDTLNDLKYAQDANLIQIAAMAALGYLTQGLTNSLVGQISRSTKEESMMTYLDKDSAVPAWLQREIGAASRKFPGEGYNQIPYIDAWGRTEATGDALERSINNLFNPAYVSQVDVDDLEAELQRLKDATGSASVFPERAERSITVDGEKKNLTAEEYQKYATTLGQSSYALVKEGTSLAAYRAMNDAEKVEYIADLYTYTTAAAKAEMGGAALDGWKLNARNAQKDLGVSTAEYIALYQKYGGNVLSGNAYKRTKAAVAAGLSVDEYVSVKKSADANGNGTVTKDEAIAVLAGLPNRVDLWDIICTTSAKNPYA